MGDPLLQLGDSFLSLLGVKGILFHPSSLFGLFIDRIEKYLSIKCRFNALVKEFIFALVKEFIFVVSCCRFYCFTPMI